MTLPPASSDRTLHIYLSLAQYPILQTQIRARMRRELFERGVLSPEDFEAEVKQKAIHSQRLEVLNDPMADEPADIWELRLSRVREHLTDFYFAYNLPFDLFNELVRQTLAERGAIAEDLQVSFNPELAPQNMLFEQAVAIENIPPADRKHLQARLQEIKVVLIRTMISDQLAYVKIAKDWFTIDDLNEIRTHKIGHGKIGGKAAGMLLAYRILNEVGDETIRDAISIPESYFIGADLLYNFMALNNLMHWADQKYKTEGEIRSDFPQLKAEFSAGQLPPETREALMIMLVSIGRNPIIVRSSSLLEDNFGTSFAGKYDSYFCPNQGTLDENLEDLTMAIKKIYASSLNPNALLYRQTRDLIDYDERMAVLIQTVQGDIAGRYFLPHAAGVAFSRNLYRWSPQIRREDGFLRLVWGLGTRAVDRVGNDYPRLVALSHPHLHPEVSSRDTRRYSQRFVDLIDLEDNKFKSLPIDEAIDPGDQITRYIAQVDQDGYLAPLRITMPDELEKKLVITFDGLFRRTDLAILFTRILQTLEKHYCSPVDTEFTVHIEDPASARPEVRIALLQCRPLSYLQEINARIPANLKEKHIIFRTKRMAPQGRVSAIRYILYVSPEKYFSLETLAARGEVGRTIGRLNAALAKETFICIGPGRWGSINPDLGVPVSYADIYNTRALVEITGPSIGPAPEASFGTHFFQDLVESNIYPLAVYLNDNDALFRKAFFDNAPNSMEQFIPESKTIGGCLTLVDITSYRPGYKLELVMDDEQTLTVAFLKKDGSEFEYPDSYRPNILAQG
ncbi:MAG: PEP/pyruvate-binding domain-containing protein [Anaerolineales bacterium]